MKSTIRESTIRVGKKVYNAEERPSMAPWVRRMKDGANKVILEKTATGVRAETKEID